MLVPELFGFPPKMGPNPGIEFSPIGWMNPAEPLVGILGKLALCESQQRLPAGGEPENVGFEIPIPESILSTLDSQRQMVASRVQVRFLLTGLLLSKRMQAFRLGVHLLGFVLFQAIKTNRHYEQNYG